METEGSQERVACESVTDAVWWLPMVDTLLTQSKPSSYEELLDRPFEMLTSDEWKQLLWYEPVSDSKELATV